MAQPLTPERARTLRRRHKRERQAVIYGSLVAALAVAGLGGAAVYTDAISVPFLDREFTSPAPEVETTLPDPPCPAEGTMPVTPPDVQVAVFNASDRSGLAGRTASDLTARTFTVTRTGDYPVSIAGTSQINFGEAGLAHAYTLATHLTDPVLVLDLRGDATVDLVLGEEFTALVEPGAVLLDPAAPFVGVEGCVPLEIARGSARPAPAPAPVEDPAATEGEPAPEG